MLTVQHTAWFEVHGRSVTEICGRDGTDWDLVWGGEGFDETKIFCFRGKKIQIDMKRQEDGQVMAKMLKCE